MIDLHAIITAHMDEPFASIPARLTRVPDADVLWVNPDAATIDPAYRETCGMDLERYRRHIADHCAYLYAGDRDALDAIGRFDRYGGDGMGKNGGSGRAVNLGAYNIKGVGRSRLVSAMTDFAHASGYAFLEEALREAIMSRAIEKVLPDGVVPILAIIGLPQYVTWPAGSFPPGERRVLIVRPRIARPAHLEVAATYVPADPAERDRDMRRVIGWRALVCDPTGKDDFLQTITTTYEKWASRYAKCLLAKWSLGGISPSNIDVSGRFLDFGGASELPSLGNYAVGYAAWSWDEVKTIRRSINSLVSAMLDVPSTAENMHPEAHSVWQSATQAFNVTIMSGLDLVGVLEGNDLAEHLKTPEASDQWEMAVATIDYLSGIRLPINQVGGPQLVAIRDALGKAWKRPSLRRTHRRLHAHLRLECSGSSRETATMHHLPIRHREKLRRSLHERIIAEGPIGKDFVEQVIEQLSQ